MSINIIDSKPKKAKLSNLIIIIIFTLILIYLAIVL